MSSPPSLHLSGDLASLIGSTVLSPGSGGKVLVVDDLDRLRGLEVGADDFLSKPVNAAELSARIRSLLRIKRYTDELDSAESVLLSLALTIEARDATTDGHCQRLARYAVALGTDLG